MQIIVILMTLVFVKIAYAFRKIAILALIGGFATVLQVFYYGLFEIAAHGGNAPLSITVILVLLVGLFQTASMLYLLINPKMARYYAFSKEVQVEWKGQLEAFTQQQRNQR